MTPAKVIDWLGLVLVVLVGVMVWATLLSPSPPQCLRFEDKHPLGMIIARNGELLSCRSLNEDSLDVECRVMEVKPCQK